MNEIFNYLQEHQIEGNYVSDFLGSRFEFKIYDYEVRITYKEDMTIQEFKDEANSQCFQHMKRQAEFYKKMSDGYLKQVDNFKPILR